MSTPASKPVFVACDGVKLKLTCTAALLEKPFVECIVQPFLGAFNKKRGTSFAPTDLAKVEVDSAVIDDLSLTGAAVLGTDVLRTRPRLWYTPTRIFI